MQESEAAIPNKPTEGLSRVEKYQLSKSERDLDIKRIEEVSRQIATEPKLYQELSQNPYSTYFSD